MTENAELRIIKTLQHHMPPFVRFILHRLKEAGHEGVIVGGALRDAALNRRVTDWDVATAASGQVLRRLFRGTPHFSLKHDTMTLVHEGRHVEVTPFRGKRPSLRQDLSRRDFTINAMAYDPEKDLFADPFEGLKDIRSKQIRAVADPRKRFEEDPIRLMRAVRFSAELGFAIEPGTQSELSQLNPLIATSAPERVRDEMTKLLLGPTRPSIGFNRMAAAGLLKQLIPELAEGILKRQNSYHRYTIFKHIMETVDRTEPTLIFRLAGLLHDVAKPRVRTKKAGVWRFYGHETESARMAEEIMNRFRFKKEVVREVVALIRHHLIGYRRDWGDAAVRRFIRRAGPHRVMDLIAFRRADLQAHGRGDDGSNLLDELARRVQKEIRAGTPTDIEALSIDGNDVMAILNIPPGPQVGGILQEMLELVMQHPDMNHRDRLSAILGERNSL
ncbi:MAG: CCA tRNA nucleotidyltransferase [Deltaproteobacteria bacterium]|nr:CCA tRNA nucleotidyltransferase [Deltaproteobacteria bacterium]